MRYQGVPENLVEQLNPSNVERYAQASGWERIPGLNGYTAVYKHPDSDIDQLIVPLDRTLDDFGRRMADVLIRLASRENRSAEEVLVDLLMPVADVLRFQLEGSPFEHGTIRFAEGIRLLMGIRKTLRATACSAIHSQAFHPRSRCTEVDELLAACRLGRSEPGNYTVVLACPMHLPNLQALPGEGAPFARQVTLLLMRSLGRLEAALETGGIDDLVQSAETEEIPLSANLCEGLLEMQPGVEEGVLTVQVSWAWTHPLPEVCTSIPDQVRIHQDRFALLGELAHRLRQATEPAQQSFTGFVEELAGSPGTNGQVQGEVVLCLINPEGESFRARASLGPNEYDQALEAHRHTFAVEVQGTLRRGPRLHLLTSITFFRVSDRRPVHP